MRRRRKYVICKKHIFHLQTTYLTTVTPRKAKNTSVAGVRDTALKSRIREEEEEEMEGERLRPIRTQAVTSQPPGAGFLDETHGVSD